MKTFLAIVLFSSVGFAQILAQLPGQKVKLDVQLHTRSFAQAVQMNAVTLYNDIWRSMYKETPCQAWADLGTDAKDAHQRFIATLTYMASQGLDISKMQGDGSTLVDNADGTVSCTPPAPAQPAAPASPATPVGP